MSRPLAWAVCALCLAGCGDPPPAPEPASSEARPSASEAPAEPTAAPEPAAMRGGVELVLYDDSITIAGPQKPRFRVSSPNVSIGKDGVHRLEQVQAVIYGKNDDEIHVTADGGWFDEPNKQAALEGTVVLRSGPQTIELEELTWNNEAEEARSDLPLTITDGETKLEATAMRYYPKRNKAIVLHELVGTIDLGQLKEGSTPL